MLNERYDNMRNIFSYKEGSLFSGKEIKDFCKDQIENKKSHAKEAKRIYLHYNLKDFTIYALVRLSFGPGTDQCRTGENLKIAFRKV